MSVCLSHCLSVSLLVGLFACPLAISKAVRPNFSQFLYMLLVATALSSCDDGVIRYVLLLLSMTTCFHLMQGIGQNQRQHICFLLVLLWYPNLGFLTDRQLPKPRFLSP